MRSKHDSLRFRFHGWFHSRFKATGVVQYIVNELPSTRVYQQQYASTSEEMSHERDTNPNSVTLSSPDKDDGNFRTDARISDETELDGDRIDIPKTTFADLAFGG